MNGFRAWLSRLRDTEPARWAELARTVIAFAVGAGWIVVDQETVNWAVTGVGLLASWVLTGYVRSSVYSKDTVRALTGRRGARHRTDPPVPVDEEGGQLGDDYPHPLA